MLQEVSVSLGPRNRCIFFLLIDPTTATVGVRVGKTHRVAATSDKPTSASGCRHRRCTMQALFTSALPVTHDCEERRVLLRYLNTTLNFAVTLLL